MFVAPVCDCVSVRVGMCVYARVHGFSCLLIYLFTYCPICALSF